MFPHGNRFARAAFCLTTCLVLAIEFGCGGKPPWYRGPEGPLLETVKLSELKPGAYCEIDMVVPPTALQGSFDCYKGTVKEVTHDEVVLTDAEEDRCIEYANNANRRPPTQQNRDLVRVPIGGVDAIWALPPSKESVAPKPPVVTQSPLKLPSSGAQPFSPPPGSPPAAAASGNPLGASRWSPLPDAAAHFDPPPASAGAAQ
jgi:hypothetical protein